MRTGAVNLEGSLRRSSAKTVNRMRAFDVRPSVKHDRSDHDCRSACAVLTPARPVPSSAAPGCSATSCPAKTMPPGRSFAPASGSAAAGRALAAASAIWSRAERRTAGPASSSCLAATSNRPVPGWNRNTWIPPDSIAASRASASAFRTCLAASLTRLRLAIFWTAGQLRPTITARIARTTIISRSV